MLDNIVKYNAIRLQESLNEYLKGMMNSLQESSVGFNERKQCEIIWKPVYEEYRRIGYRLKEVK